MVTHIHDSALLVVMLGDFERGKVPRALHLLNKVNGGASVDDFDIEFLEQIFFEAHALMPLLDRHPEFQDVGAQILGLCEEIMRQAFENELLH